MRLWLIIKCRVGILFTHSYRELRLETDLYHEDTRLLAWIESRRLQFYLENLFAPKLGEERGAGTALIGVG